MAELADALASGASGSNPVGVRISPRALLAKNNKACYNGDRSIRSLLVNNKRLAMRRGLFVYISASGCGSTKRKPLHNIHSETKKPKRRCAPRPSHIGHRILPFIFGRNFKRNFITQTSFELGCSRHSITPKTRWQEPHTI